ncbi:MAG: flagellin [Rhodobacteraceae bacterium]|nr:flagellin [Paracoccaceae bacterium]
MSLTTFGDAARLHGLGASGARLRADLARLSQDLSTGTRADPGAATGGDFGALSANRRAMDLTESYGRAIDAALGRAEATQAILGLVGDEIDGIAPRLLEFSLNGDYHDLMLTNASAQDRLEAVVGALNTRIGGSAVLAGDAPSARSLIDAGAMLDALRPLVAAAPDADAAIAAVADWMQAPGGGFDTHAWQGGDGPPPAVLVAEGRNIDAAVTARDPALRSVLTGLALAALAAEDAGPPGPETGRVMLEAAAGYLQSGEAQLTGLRATLGADEHRLVQARATAEATRAGLELDYAALVGVDPYETATALQETQFRLESLYVVTARLANFSLTGYLR